MKPRRSRRPAASGTTQGSSSGTTSSRIPEIRPRLNASELSLVLEAVAHYRGDLNTPDSEEWRKVNELARIYGRLAAAGNNLSHPGTKSYAKRS